MRGALLHPVMATTTASRMFAFLVWCCFLTAVNADMNITLDDNDPLIVYNPLRSWTESSSNELDYGGHHMLTDDSTATATFTFTGTAIYYMAPLWPYRINTFITLDDTDGELVSLRDHSEPEVENGPESSASKVVWFRDGLDNVEHTLVISIGEDEDVAVVDGLLYTVSDISTTPNPTSDPSTSSTSAEIPTDTSSQPTLILTSSSPSSPSSSSSILIPSPTSVSAAASSSKPAGLSTAIGIVCALFGLLAIGAVFWWWRRRRLQRENDETLSDLPLPPEMAEASNSGSPMWRTRSARYRDIALHAAASTPPVVPAAVSPGRRTSGGRRRPPPPPPHRKQPPVLKKPLTTIPEVSSRLASGAVLTARDIETEEGDADGNAPFAPGHTPEWADVRLVTPSASGLGNDGSGGKDHRREDDPWTIRDQ